MTSRTIKSAYGFTLERTYTFDRVLEIAGRLCWNPQDLGLNRLHLVGATVFPTRKLAEAHAREHDICFDEIRYFFGWLDAVNQHSGVARETFLQEQYWPKREQINNIMLDSIFQAYKAETRHLFSALIGQEFGPLEFIKSKATNHARKFTGQPDTMLLDETNHHIIAIEIKLASTATKYTADQHLKYMTLTRLMTCDEFFPGYTVHNVLLAPHADFLKNTVGMKSFNPVTNSEGRVSFNYDGVSESTDSVIDARVALLRGETIHPNGRARDHNLHHFSWSRLLDAVPKGRFREHIAALMPHLQGDLA